MKKPLEQLRYGERFLFQFSGLEPEEVEYLGHEPSNTGVGYAIEMLRQPGTKLSTRVKTPWSPEGLEVEVL